MQTNRPFYSHATKHTTVERSIVLKSSEAHFGLQKRRRVMIVDREIVISNDFVLG